MQYGLTKKISGRKPTVMKYKAKYLITAGYDGEVIKAYLDSYSPGAAKRLFEKIKSNMELAK